MEHYSENRTPIRLEKSADFLSQLAKNKEAPVRLLEWAGCLALENKKWELAENIFSHLLKRRDKVLDQVGLAKSFLERSLLDPAEKHYLSALYQISEPCPLLFIIYKALGEIGLLKNNFAMAEEYYNKAGTLNPSCFSLIFHRAILHLKEKKYKSAEKGFQKVVQSQPRYAKAWQGLALVRKALGDEDLALACLNRSLDIEPHNQKALRLKHRWQNYWIKNSSTTLSFSA